MISTSAHSRAVSLQMDKGPLEIEGAEEGDTLKPEKNLIRAFLDRMVKDALGLSTDIQRHYLRAARAWMKDDETVAPFSLAWVCLALDKSTDKFKRLVEQLDCLTKAEIQSMLGRSLKGIRASGRGTSSSNIYLTARPKGAQRRRRGRPKGSKAKQ